MSRLSGVLKPCYVFAPRTLIRRVAMDLFQQGDPRVVRLPWGVCIRVNPGEAIGRELIRQNVFDIAVSETAWRLLQPGDLAVDVGANIGYIATLFAARVGSRGRVEAFEPHPRIFSQLRDNAAQLGPAGSAARIVLHECALGSRDGTARLFEPRGFVGNEGVSTMIAPPTADPAETAAGLEIQIARLDTVLSDCDIALLKVDVEGFESEVFAGAERLLAAQRIRNIIYEAHDCERSSLHELLSRHGYSVFGIGHDLFGLKISSGTDAPKVDRRWESPSYLATLNPSKVLPSLRARGWQVLHHAK